MSTPLTRQNDNVLNALNEGRLQGRVEALIDVENILRQEYDTHRALIEIQELLVKAKENYTKWFE